MIKTNFGEDHKKNLKNRRIKNSERGFKKHKCKGSGKIFEIKLTDESPGFQSQFQ
jgi:hypothetical protein